MTATSALQSTRLLELNATADKLRAEILEILTGLGEDRRGHPGPSLSIVELVTALYFDILRIDPSNAKDPKRDRFILSKGHGCLTLYAALARRGFFPRKHLSTFRSIGSILQGHPDMTRTPGVDMTSGSLGNGLGAAVGMALALRLSAEDTRVYVLMGDGELQEGVVWEAALAATRYRLGNVVVFVDCNGFQAGGRIEEIMPLQPMRAKWEAFGWNVVEIDGHDIQQILNAVQQASRDTPLVILAHTVKGKGVAYMEDNNEWHQRALPGAMPRGSSGTKNGSQHLVSTRTAYGQALLDLAKRREEIFILAADAFISMGLDSLRTELPGRCVDAGIAEQDLMMMAAGLAATGKTVFTSVYSAFAIRACEQIRSFIAYPNLNVKIVGGMAGFSGGIEGVTHMGTEDIAIMRSMPNMVVLNPADATATSAAIRVATEHVGPVYIRLGRDPSPIIFGSEYRMEIGRERVIVDDGSDAALLSSGLITSEVIVAASILRRAGHRCKVIDCPSLKPFDEDLMGSLALQIPVIFTIEEHVISGGLGSAVVDALAGKTPVHVERMGLCDCFAESGTPEELRFKYGLTAEQIAARVRRYLESKPSRGTQN